MAVDEGPTEGSADKLRNLTAAKDALIAAGAEDAAKDIEARIARAKAEQDKGTCARKMYNQAAVTHSSSCKAR
eukprot:6008297-Alexandrium_andersonii.AAC.1